MHACQLLGAAVIAAASLSGTSPVARAAGPHIENDRLVFPENGDIPRYMTEAERRYLEQNPGYFQTAATPPPEGPIICPGEYEPVQGIILAWEGATAQRAIVATMAAHITTAGNADVYVMCDSSGLANTARSQMISAGANPNRIFTYVVTLDTIWIRDYGPRYIYEGGVRAIIDHTYNRPRPNDDVQPIFWANASGHRRYEIPLIHGGGNYHLNSLTASWATRLIVNENPSLTESQIVTYWNQYQGVNTTLTSPFPTSVDLTQHIDMWMQITGPSTAMISDWPWNSGSTQDVICDTVAAAMTSAGWTITRVPAHSVGGTHYTYTNVVMCNDIILVPTYTNATVATARNGNALALAAWQTAAPDKTLIQVPCQNLVTAAGVMHCICMHVPANSGGENPVAYLRQPRGGEVLEPGHNFEIRWITDDDKGVSNVDILLSTDGGATFPTVIAAATADDGSFFWNVPSVHTTQAVIKVVARDADGNTGSDQSPQVFTLNAPPPICPGDADGSNTVDFDDITEILANWGASAPAPYQGGDANGDGTVNFDDITETLANWGGSC